MEFYIPEQIKKSVLNLYDMQGKQLRAYNIPERGSSGIIISGNDLWPGMFMYTLITDSNVVDTKQMVLTE